VQRLESLLAKLGYHGGKAQTESLTSYECLYGRQDSFGVRHFIDVHWRLNNAQIFANTFTFDELHANAVQIPTLAPSALGLSHTHALLLACLHRFAHAHAPFYADGKALYAGDHLRWTYDIHLLSSVLNAAQWSDFTQLAGEKAIAKFCFDGLNAAREAFDTRIPTNTIRALDAATKSGAMNLRKLRNSGAAWFIANLRALPEMHQKLSLIRQLTFPPSGLIMKKYQIENRALLPNLYGHRLIKGVAKRIKGYKRRT
jgi:hypothetical protein